MIPVQLTIQGLYSYREKQTIDFSQMTAAHLFGIFGSVGSGKSTILEAITYAIYGRTDRLNLAGDNRFYNMMNLKSNELLIDFIFVAGKEQSTFRAIVKGKRNSRKFEEVKTLERVAYRKVEDDWMPVDLNALEEAIGLSYDNFKRTIIIPQGQFQEFLQLGNKDRTQMMKELFNLGKYEFFGKVSSLEAKTNARKQHIEGEIQGLGQADAEMLTGYEVQLSEIQQELKGLSENQQKLQKEEENLRNLKELTAKLTEAVNNLRQLQGHEPAFREQEIRVKRYEQCNFQFKSLLSSIDDLSGKLKTRDTEIREFEQSLQNKEGEIKELENTLEASKEEYEKRDELKKMAEELELLARIRRLQAEMNIASERQKKGTVILAQTIQTVEKLKGEKSQKEASLKAERVKIPDMTMLANAKAWHSEKKSLEGVLKEIKGEILKNRDEEAANRKTFRHILTDQVFSTLPSEADIGVILTLLSTKKEEIKKKIRDVETEIGHLHVKIQLKEYAENLVEGDACPVCGSKHHPEKYDAAGIREELQKLERVKAEFEKQVEHISGLGQQIDRLESEWSFNRLYLESASARLNEQQLKLDTHLARLSFAAYSEETEVEKAFNDAVRIQSEIKKEELEIDRLSDLLNKEESDRDRYQEALHKIDHEITALKSEIGTFTGQLTLIKEEDFTGMGEEEIRNQKRDLLIRLNMLVSQHKEGNRLLNEMKTAKGRLSGQLEASGKEREQENQRFGELETKLQDQLSKSENLTAEAVREILAEELDLDGEKRKLTVFWEQLKLSENLSRQLQVELGDRQYDAELHEKLNGELSVLAGAITTKTERVGALNGLVTAMKERLVKQADLRKELEQTEQRAENLKTLKSLFKASGFVNYISTVYLQNLCKAANERFSRMTRQKLSLEITPDNNFEVRDYLNGGKVRSVKTLSGGQTFQAALSLALALADNIQKINESDQNFFFLDEGFGSLDKESLSVVFDTLKSLRHENRIVGVISHVEEMQQEIEVHLRIENLEETGSKIIPSWTI